MCSAIRKGFRALYHSRLSLVLFDSPSSSAIGSIYHTLSQNACKLCQYDLVNIGALLWKTQALKAIVYVVEEVVMCPILCRWHLWPIQFCQGRQEGEQQFLSTAVLSIQASHQAYSFQRLWRSENCTSSHFSLAWHISCTIDYDLMDAVSHMMLAHTSPRSACWSQSLQLYLALGAILGASIYLCYCKDIWAGQ